MTLDGTNSWVLREPGSERVVVVDPGPLHEGHLTALAAVGDVALIVLTHGHADHSEGAPRLRELTGAPVTGFDPAYCLGAEPLTADLRSDRSQRSAVAGLEWLTLLTPGHTSDSACFLLEADRALLTGDTILGRGTTVVAHPDGRLAAYLDSLGRLHELAADGSVSTILPGHGPVLTDALTAIEGYQAHRAERLAQVQAAVAAGAHTPSEVVAVVYADVDRALWPAAELSVQAQLDYLTGSGG
jgi:glyoxylase-like metal-dependent hydrolase (beta-lactamase superfamily II)